MKEDALMIVKEKTKLRSVMEFIFNSRWYTLVVAMILLLKTIFFYANTVFKDDTIWLWSVRQTCFFIIIIVFPMLFFRKAVRRFEAGAMINLLISSLLFADELYYTYASNILSVMQVRKYAV